MKTSGCLLTRIDRLDEERDLIKQAAADAEKRKEVLFVGTLQATSSGHLTLSVPSALTRGLYEALDSPGVSFPYAAGGGMSQTGIVVMTPAELRRVGGKQVVTERGRTFRYVLGAIQESPAVGWPGVSTCWHIRVRSPELANLRKSYGLHPKVEGLSDFSIVIGCRRSGMLTRAGISKVAGSQMPGWAEAIRDKFRMLYDGEPWQNQKVDLFDPFSIPPNCFSLTSSIAKTAVDKPWYIASSDIQGEGIFAGKDLDADDRIGIAAYDGGKDMHGNTRWELTLLGRKCNHAKRANIVLRKDGSYAFFDAVRNISKDEELVCDYMQATRELGRRAVLYYGGKEVPRENFDDYVEL